MCTYQLPNLKQFKIVCIYIYDSSMEILLFILREINKVHQVILYINFFSKCVKRNTERNSQFLIVWNETRLTIIGSGSLHKN